MSFKTYTAIRIFVVAIMGGLIGWAVANGNALIPIPVAIAALVILLLLRRELMSFKTYIAIRIGVVAIMGGLIGWAVANGNALIPIPMAIAAVVILLLFRRGVKEIVVDERIYSIAEKASYLAFRIFGIAAAVTSATLVALGWESSSDLYKIGLALAYAVCGLMLIYYIAYIYYNRKYSGKK